MSLPWELVAALCLGAVAGSYIATLVIRWPQGLSASSGRSRCDHCGRKLGAADLVPLLSYALQRGRCRTCGGAIDGRHPTMEAASAAIGMVAFLALDGAEALVSSLLGWWLLLAATLDVEHHWLPDKVTLPLVPAGLAGALLLDLDIKDRLIGAAIGFAALWLLARAYRVLRGREGLGGGDPKLLAGIGAWLGWQFLPFVLLGAGLAGLVAVMLVWLRGGRVTGSDRLPLGTLMALAAWPLWLVGL